MCSGTSPRPGGAVAQFDAPLMANLLKPTGTDWLLTVDLREFFDRPVDHHFVLGLPASHFERRLDCTGPTVVRL
nr:hypothetical protein GCM10010200_005680 [Actinomadura rugatobispora]